MEKSYCIMDIFLYEHGTLYENLYKLDLFDVACVDSFINTNVVPTVAPKRARISEHSSSYRRLGHISSPRIERLVKDNIFLLKLTFQTSLLVLHV